MENINLLNIVLTLAGVSFIEIARISSPKRELQSVTMKFHHAPIKITDIFRLITFYEVLGFEVALSKFSIQIFQ